MKDTSQIIFNVGKRFKQKLQHIALRKGTNLSDLIRSTLEERYKSELDKEIGEIYDLPEDKQKEGMKNMLMDKLKGSSFSEEEKEKILKAMQDSETKRGDHLRKT